MAGFEPKVGHTNLVEETFGPRAAPAIAGKRTLTEQLGPGAPVQRSPGAAGVGMSPAGVYAVAARGVEGTSGALPHGDTIQQLFGRHDISGVQAHIGGDATTASRAIGAEAYATGHHVAFAREPSLHTAAPRPRTSSSSATASSSRAASASPVTRTSSTPTR